MIDINEELVKYNANAKDRSTGDCVIRSLSLAYGIDYKRTASELHKIRRDNNYPLWNIEPCYGKFLDSHGYKEKRSISPDDRITVEEFCDNNLDGTYVLLVGKNKNDNKTSHMVCIIDGNIYDSWDCSNWYVKKLYTITGDRSDIEVPTKYNMNKLSEYALKKFTDSFYDVRRQLKDYHDYDDDGDIHISDPLVSDYSIKINLIYRPTIYGETQSYHLDIVYKFTPKNTEEDKVKIIDNLTKYNMRGFYKGILKDIENMQEAEMLTGEYEPAEKKYWSGSRYEQLVKKLPRWCRKLVSYVWINDSRADYRMGYKYEVVMNALKEDPRYEELPTVTFYADTLPELIRDIEDYRKNYNRVNYDY